jgi:uncharacterized membrane protein YuzA (DUF378 family)
VLKIWENMDNLEQQKKNKSKKIAYILGGIALVWYVLSMFTIWQQ